MNERQRADELGAMIDNRIENTSGGLPADDAAFAMCLLALRDQTYADDVFAADLEARLKAAARSPFTNRRSDRRGRLVYAMATFAAALVIVTAGILTVPPLRIWTETVYSQVFAPAAQTTETAVVTPTTLVEAPASGYALATTPLSSGFHVMGQALQVNDFAVSLAESAFISYVNLITSVNDDSLSS